MKKSSYLRIMVDLKGIEPSNLSDANRTLSQLSYRPIFAARLCRENYCNTPREKKQLPI